MGSPRIGVLSLQGDFARHRASLEALGAGAVRVSQPRDMERLDALVLPGGESSTMLHLLESTGLRGPVEGFVRERPVLATCAGVILLADHADHLPRPSFGVLDVTVERNAYGRQIHSFSTPIEIPVLGGPFDAVFIRAPRIRRVGSAVEVLARHDGEAVAVRQGSVVALCFHPELTRDLRLHGWFLREVVGLAVPENSGAREEVA